MHKPSHVLVDTKTNIYENISLQSIFYLQQVDIMTFTTLGKGQLFSVFYLISI